MEVDRCDDSAKDGASPLLPPVTCCWTQRLSAICHPAHTSGDRVRTCALCVKLAHTWPHNGEAHTCADATSAKRLLSMPENISGCVQMMSETTGITQRAALDRDVQSLGD